MVLCMYVSLRLKCIDKCLIKIKSKYNFKKVNKIYLKNIKICFYKCNQINKLTDKK